MLFTHSERYRGSFMAETSGRPTGSAYYIKPHTYCPANIAEYGGEFFDNGILPTEPGLYANELNYNNCPPEDCNAAKVLNDLLLIGGSVYINGSFTLNSTVTIPRGRQIIGVGPDAELKLGTPGIPLLRIHVKILITMVNDIRVSGIVIRDLKLTTTQPIASNTTGLAIIGEFDNQLPPAPDTGRPGVSSDLHFSRLTFNGFTTGLSAAPDPGERQGHPMIDGVSLKNISFVNNATAFLNTSSNTSNWNVMDLNIQSNINDAVGWSQVYGGHQGLQDVRCTGVGTLITMKDCIRVQMVGGFYLNGLKPTTKVTNALTVGESNFITQVPPYAARHASTMVLRNSDFTSSTIQMGRMNVLGKAFITSMNNQYKYFNVESAADGNLTRLTHCGDTYNFNGIAYPGLDDVHPNLWVGLDTPTRIQCGSPLPWEEAVRWTGDWDDNVVGAPLVGNFHDDVQEDFVVYRPGSPAQFLIQQPAGPGRFVVSFVDAVGKPLVGRFFPNSRAQVVIFANGQWLVKDPNNSANNTTWNWGLANDIPFVGNFYDESGQVSGNKDEIAIYRPTTKTFWIASPRTTWYQAFMTNPDYDSEIVVADFLGNGHDQIAQYKNGVWNIIDPQGGATYTVNLGQSCDPGQPCDVPLPGRYLPQLPGSPPCAQVAVWRRSTEQFFVADPFYNCGTRSTSMFWGSNNKDFEDDIPLTINDVDFPLLRRPTAYRRTKGAYDHGLGDGQWWVHDLF